jgi:peptide chain release factor
MSVHLLLSAGRGPAECAWALANLITRLETEAHKDEVTITRLQTVPGELPNTYRSILIRVTGENAASFAAGWTGTLCWQAPSPYRPSTGRKNWYVIAQVCEPEGQRRTFSETDVDIAGIRTGGPGGQHRNKASTAVRATHRPTGTVIVVDTERQFSLNRSIAMRLLRERLQRGDDAAARDAITARWRVHDDLIRGNPTRTERP